MSATLQSQDQPTVDLEQQQTTGLVEGSDPALQEPEVVDEDDLRPRHVEGTPKSKGDLSWLKSKVFYKDVFGEIGRSAKKNLIPGIVILLLEIAIIVIFYQCKPCGVAFTAISKVKTSWGYGYSALATAVFGGLFPWIIASLTKQLGTNKRWVILASCPYMLFQFAFMGIVVDTFYRFQAWLWGPGSDLKTVACKVLFDMFVWNPFCGIWLSLALFHFRFCEFSFRTFFKTWTLFFAVRSGMTSLFTTWMIWGPAVCIIYAMPSTLQVPLFNFVLCFANLIMLLVTRPKTDTARADSGVPTLNDIEIKPLAQNPE